MKKPQIDGNTLEQICKVIADTNCGLTGSEIGGILQEMNIYDPGSRWTKWRILKEALSRKDSGYVYIFIQKSMDPVRFIDRKDVFEERRDKLNTVISFVGVKLDESGKLVKTSSVSTISEAEKKTNTLRRKLTSRSAHMDVLSVCQKRYLEKDYNYAVFEAVKSVAKKIRDKSNKMTDGVTLVNEVLNIPSNGYPLLAFNPLKSQSDKSEHNGIKSLIIGIVKLFRNPTAHMPENEWPISEQDALDLLSTVSLIHRYLDKAVLTSINSNK